MVHPGETGIPGMRRRGSDRTPLRWGAGLPSEGRTFDEELALFERQVREEKRERPGRGASTGRGSSGT